MMHRLQLKAVEWNVSLEDTRETPGSVLGFGGRDGLGVVLKITKVAGDESHSGEVLKAYGGDGAVRVYESETGAVLLERLEPGEDLVDLVTLRGLGHRRRLHTLSHRPAPSRRAQLGRNAVNMFQRGTGFAIGTLN